MWGFGSGRVLVNEVLAKSRHMSYTVPSVLGLRRIEGLDQFDQVVRVDRSPIGKVPINPATFNEVFDLLRKLSQCSLSQIEILAWPVRFLPGGRCERCRGWNGQVSIPR